MQDDDDGDEDWDLPTDDDSDDDEDDTVPCPYCSEPIWKGAAHCEHCGNFISEEDKPWSKPWWLVAGVIACLVCIYCWVTYKSD